jgi:hypothetical protein
MKRILLVFLIIIVNSSFADYSTPGTGVSWNLDSLVTYSGGNVTYSNGIYFVNDTITISESDTLKILNNATVKLSSLVLININGTLKTNPPDSLLITAADTNQKFLGMRFDSLSDASVLKRMIFEYGNAVKMVDANISIDSCIFRYNTLASNFSSGTINLFRSDAIISNSKIYGNRRSAIISSSNIPSSPWIIGNTIYENNVFNENYPQINLGASGSNPVIIRDNIIRGLYDMAGGISFFPIGSIQSCIVENNIIKKNRYGIAFQNANINAYVVNNIIDSNNINPNAMTGGSGINLYGNSSINVVISRNKIRWNLWGVTIQSTAKPNLGDLNDPDTNAHGWNYIYGNFHNDTTADLYNNTPDSIKAENNFWGTGNLDTIEMHIFHKPDNPALGFVDYIPIYLPLSINKNSNPVPLGYKLYDAYPNPFNPITIIKFDIINSREGLLSPVKLTLYDILGKEVLTLVNKRLQPGTYKIEWNAAKYSSGVYFYKLDAGNFSQTKKLILIK